MNAPYLAELAIHQLWQGALLAAGAWLLLRVRPGWSAESRHALWVVVLIAAAALPALTLLPRNQVVAGTLQVPALVIKPAPSAATVKRMSVTSAVTPPASGRSAVTTESLIRLALGAWLMGVLFKILALTRAALVLRRWRRDAVRVPAERLPPGLRELRGCEVRESRDIGAPMAVGMVRPCVLLPVAFSEKFTVSQLNLVLLHELAHVRRGDLWMVLVQRLIEAIYFYNPVMHWVSRQIERERECSCDDRALRLAQGGNVEYADCLVVVTQQIRRPRVTALAVGAMHRTSELRHRVERLLQRLDGAETRASWRSVGVATLGLCALAVVMALSVPQSVAAQEPATDPNRWKSRALVEAAQENDLATVTALLEAGADVDYPLVGDGTPTVVAARSGNLQLVRLLIERGADPNVASPGDGNPLIVAAAGGHMPIVTVLLEHGADVNAYVRHDETPLINAAREGHLEVVRYLVEKGADVNLAVDASTPQVTRMRSPLGEALEHGHGEVARYLQERGART